MHCAKFLYRCEWDTCSCRIYTEYISIYLPTFWDYLSVPSSKSKQSKKNAETLMHAVGTTVYTIPYISLCLSVSTFFLDGLGLKNGTDSPETSLDNYQCTLCDIAEEQLMDNIKLLLLCILRVLLSHSFIFFRFYILSMYIYMVLFLFDNVIYVFLLLWQCIIIVCLCMATLTEVFPCFFLSCKANTRVKPAKTGHGPHSS
jgi:hypothetical protein